MHVDALPFLDLLSPDFEFDSAAIKAAREESWLARTPFGFAVLRYDEISSILKDPRLHQGSAAILALRGVTDGPLVDWWKGTILNIDGAEHTRLRRLVAKAFTPPAVERLRPFFRATAERLVDAFGPDGRCEFVSAFSEPYPLEGICEMLGIPPERRPSFYGWAGDLGLIFSQHVGQQRSPCCAHHAVSLPFSLIWHFRMQSTPRSNDLCARSLSAAETKWKSSVA